MEIKGYYTATNYMGYLPESPRANEDGYAKFDSEADYRDTCADILVEQREKLNT